MGKRLGPVDINYNISTVSEITLMAGKVDIEEKVAKEVTTKMEKECYRLPFREH